MTMKASRKLRICDSTRPGNSAPAEDIVITLVVSSMNRIIASGQSKTVKYGFSRRPRERRSG